MKLLRSGYILMLTLMMVALMTALATYIVYQTADFAPTVRAQADKRKAWQLALSGVNIALAQLSVAPQQTQAAGKKAQASPEEGATTLLKTILPQLNQWQTFTCKKDREGVNATIGVCIGSEEGKFDINSLYNFSTHKFVREGQAQGDTKKALEYVFKAIAEQTKQDNLFKSFEKFLKERQYKLNDVTELLTIKEFEQFKQYVWYEPSADTKEKEKRPLYLTDIFTVWSNKATIEPWLLSASVSGVLGLQRASLSREQVAESLKKFKLQSAWQTEWDKVLKPLYQKEFKVIAPTITPFLATQFDATIFWVLSRAQIGTLTQKLLAIVERQSSEDKKNGTVHVTCKIRKLYWL